MLSLVMNNEIKSIFANTIGTISYLIVIFFFVTLILFMHNDVNDALKEAWVASIYFLSVLSTLGAAYIASRLFNDWRFEKDHDTKSIYLNNAIQKLSEIHSSLIECRSNANNLLKVKNHLILKTDYLNQMSINHKKVLTLLHADLTVMSKLFKKHILIENFFIYEKHINVFDSFNGLLRSEYSTYYYYYINTHHPDKKDVFFDIFRFSSPDDTSDITHKINQNEIHKFLSIDLSRLMGKKIDSCTYLNHIEECLKIHEKITNECILELKAKSFVE